MSITLTRLFCYVSYTLLSVVLMIGIALVAIEANGSSFFCGSSQKEMVNITNHNYNNDNNTQDETVDFTGKFRLIKSQDFDQFLEELGVGFLQRSIANRVSSEYEITNDGDVYTLKTISPFRTSQIKFKLNGQIFEENRMDGVRVKSSMTRNGNKWIQKQFGDKEVTIVRQFNGDMIRVTAQVNNISSVRIYERIK